MGLPSNQARALWLLIHDEHRFRRASDIVYTDAHRYSRQWNSFNGPVDATPDLNAEAMEAFKEALRQAFDTPNIHIDVYERTRPEFLEATSTETADSGKTRLMQFTIYSEGRPNAENAFVEGALTTQIRRPVVEAAVTFEPAKGIIECVASQRNNRDAVVKAFGVSILGCSPDFEPCRARNYDLTVLQERVEFATDPADRIEKVSVSLLRLFPMDSTSARITVEKLAGDKDIWTVVDERLGEGNLKTDFRIEQARIQISYRTRESDRVRTLPLTITHPHRSNIKEQSEIERIIASKYLPRWGLAASA